MSASLSDPLDRSWDARWTREEQDEAVRRADEQVLEMRTEIDQAITCVEHATNRYVDALSWMAQVRAFHPAS